MHKRFGASIKLISVSWPTANNIGAENLNESAGGEPGVTPFKLLVRNPDAGMAGKGKRVSLLTSISSTNVDSLSESLHFKAVDVKGLPSSNILKGLGKVRRVTKNLDGFFSQQEPLPFPI
uniref:Uncharacterized protein n=1 Tax=Romanomermis culicivorax TaxID=13658 RepID=A0A915JEQ4_ROMCU